MRILSQPQDEAFAANMHNLCIDVEGVPVEILVKTLRLLRHGYSS